MKKHGCTADMIELLIMLAVPAFMCALFGVCWVIAYIASGDFKRNWDAQMEAYRDAETPDMHELRRIRKRRDEMDRLGQKWPWRNER